MSDHHLVLRRVIADLAPDRVQRLGDARARVRTDGTVLDLRVATAGRALLRVTTTTFAHVGPAWEGPDLQVELGHTGAVRRTGIRARARVGGADADALARELGTDPGLASAVLPLDSTSFTIRTRRGHLVTEVVLMGASMTRLRLPPTASVIGVHGDQRDALLGSLAELDRVLAGWTSRQLRGPART